MTFLPALDAPSWWWLALAAVCTGLAKGGLGGFGLLSVIIFADVFPARQSTGLLLVSLIVADFCSLFFFHQHADWKQLRRIALPTVCGVMLGWWSMGKLSDAELRPLMGWIILGLTLLQAGRTRLGPWVERSFHSPLFAWFIGGMGGWSTMLANAAGPVLSLFFLAMRLPKMVFVGTAAWFFCLINLVKVPFGVQLGLVTWPALGLALVFSPVILLSVLGGRWVLARLPQAWFERLVLVFAVIGALRLILH